MLVPPVPAYGPVRRRWPTRQGCAAPLRLATLTPRGVVLAIGGAFFGAIALAPLVGSEFIPQTDQSFTQLSIRMPVGASLGAQRRQGAPGRGDRRQLPRGQEHRHQRRRRRPGFRSGATSMSLNIGLVDRSERTRSQKDRGRDPGEDRQDPGHRRLGRLRPADLRHHPRQRPCAARQGVAGVRREDQADPGHDRHRTVHKPGLPAYAPSA